VVLLLAAGPALGQANPKPDADALAKMAWKITDLVLEQDIDSPARQQMLLSGLKTLLHNVPGSEQLNLSARVSAVTTPEQFAAILREVLAKPEAAKALADPDENPLFHGLLPRGQTMRGSAYLSPRSLKAHEVLTGNRYVGTGIQIRWSDEEKLTQIVVPFPGGPARKAGARPGDLIVAVDGKDVKSEPLPKIVKRLQGEEGTPVSMSVRQPGQKEVRVLDMIRGVIPFSSWSGYRRLGEESWSFKVDADVPVGYLRLLDVKASTLLELRRIEPVIREQGVQALVLDLRGAQGSEMTHAALVADGLLDGGTMWRVRDGQGRVKEYKADRDCLFRDWPLAVLVNEYTGGMAQAVAAALQDNGRAVVVGQPTRGEVYVTTVVRLPDGPGGVMLRTGRFERVGKAPKAAPMDDMEESAPPSTRIRPDHEVAIDKKQLGAIMEWQAAQESPEPKADLKPPADPQFAKALALLREALAKQAPAKKSAG
jgi:carboxyl-terminal processing protease